MRRVALLGAALVAGACAGRDAAGRRVLTVYAASSLTEVFRDLAQTFEASHPGAGVSLTFAGSQVLRLQIEQGAAADVFASANPEHMHALRDEGRVREARVFAHNELVLIVPADNPAEIHTLADLPRAARLVIGTRNVPVGRYAREALHRANSSFGPDFETSVLAHVVSEESNVRLARAKVELGEADAAIVYKTDAISSDRVRTIPVPETVNVRADYLIGIVDGSAHPDLAAQWVELVLGPDGRTVLARHGFGVE